MNRAARVGLVVVIVLLASAGCLAHGPAVDLNTTDSVVFSGAAAGGSWAVGEVRTTVDLTPNATTSGVSQLNVVVDSQTFHRTALDSGETSASVVLPTNGTATLVAVNTVNGTVVETRNVTVSSDRVI